MNDTPEQRQAHIEAVRKIVEPMGFYHLGDCEFQKHPEGWRIDFSLCGSNTSAVVGFMLNEVYRFGLDYAKIYIINAVRNI